METACLTKGAGEVALVLPRGLAHAMGAGSCTTGARAWVINLEGSLVSELRSSG